MNIDIRLARDADTAALSRLYLRTRRETYYWCDSDLFQEQDFIDETRGEKILILTLDEQPQGFISYLEVESFIHHLYITPEKQNMGLGSLLLESVLRDLKKPVRLKCIKKNKSAMRFYSKRGWKKIAQGSDHTGEYITMEYIDLSE